VQQKKQALTDAAMLSVSVIQLKLQAGRKLTEAESVKLNAALDYIDAVAAINPEDGPDIDWPVLS
ncbi:MAG: tail fiber assembly protein, partial [Clostridium sp.]|nr:tail fiber assembly protein [Clostridium sp.]